MQYAATTELDNDHGIYLPEMRFSYENEPCLDMLMSQGLTRVVEDMARDGTTEVTTW